jgi:glycerophosphoryl diester phosphodiesterase
MMGVSGQTSERTLAEMQRRPLLRNGVPSPERVPSLDRVLEEFNGDFIYYIDVKRNGNGNFVRLAREIDSLLREYDLHDDVIVASHHVLTVLYMEFTHPEIITCLEETHPSFPSYYFWIPTKFRPDMIASPYPYLTEEVNQWLRRTGMFPRFITFHAREEEIDEALARGIENLIVDYGGHLDPLLSREH